VIELRDVARRYRVSGQEIHAVRGVSLSVAPGEFLSIVGHSGSGKSTLLSLIGAITRPDAGSVKIEGTDPWSLGDGALSLLRNRTFGFVYQFASLVPTLTALENVLLPSAFGTAARREDAQRLLDEVGIGDKAGRYPGALSGGEQQRVAIARAFVCRPKVILADEPTGNLDEENEAAVMAFLETMNRDAGTTVLMVTHSSELARRAPRRLRMKAGLIEEA